MKKFFSLGLLALALLQISFNPKPVTLASLGAAGSSSITTTAVTFGTSTPSTAVISSVPANTVVFLVVEPVQTIAGVGCGAGSNTVTPAYTFTNPAGSAGSPVSLGVLSSSANGSVGFAPVAHAFGTDVTIFGSYFMAQVGTSVNVSATSTLVSAGCTTVPQYQLIAKAIY